MPAAKLDRSPASDQVSAVVWEMIFDGRLRSGDRVPQDEIAHHLGISRIPVREALVRLANEGVVISKPHVGVFVAEFSPEVVRDHFQIYAQLQTLAALRFLAGPDADSGRQTIAAIGRELADTTDAAEVNRLSTKLARTINVGSGSARLRAVLRALGRMFPAELYPQIPGAMAAQQHAVALLVAAIDNGSAESIEQACAAGGAARAEAMIDHLRQRGAFT
ncbi:MAG TPA: GntR family transcriptional regulator [Ilumatobacteraceae bacterium]|nr:GntR family transcriptional regulator [Ilumatobacteraceae bacterium]